LYHYGSTGRVQCQFSTTRRYHRVSASALLSKVEFAAMPERDEVAFPRKHDHDDCMHAPHRWLARVGAAMLLAIHAQGLGERD
jgi:hypothetical protein